MGTNYYLHRASQACPTCGHDPVAEPVHIGKSSFGWVFGWRGYRAEESPLGVALTTPSEWIAHLVDAEASGSVIRDEYDEAVPLSRLLTLIEGKRGQGGNSLASNRRAHDSYTVNTPEGDDVLFCEFS